MLKPSGSKQAIFCFFSDIAMINNTIKDILLNLTELDEEQLFRFNRTDLLFPPGGI
jgi:hypothetical protein